MNGYKGQFANFQYYIPQNRYILHKKTFVKVYINVIIIVKEEDLCARNYYENRMET